MASIFTLLQLTAESSTIHIRFPQNPQFSRHFQPPLNSRLIHSVNRRLSPESPLLAVTGRSEGTPSNSPDSEPIFDQNPRVWSMFGPDSVSPKTSDSEEESVENRVNSAPNYSDGPITGGYVVKGKKGKSKEYWSIEQIGNRADRLSINAEDLFLYSSTDVEDILKKVSLLCPRAVVIDSVQTIYLQGVTGSPGGMSQLKECTAALLRFSKKTGIPVLLIGHVNKIGDIAGPRVLEHIVDTVLYMEGEKHSTYRLLRSVKNRFGSTDELGVFEMAESGLQAVLNPSEMFMSEEHSESDHLAGLAVAVIIDGSRTFLIEVQALCVADSIGKHLNGVSTSRADMIISVLKKQAGLKMQDCSVFLNVVSGVSLTETAGDLAVAAAICSSLLDFPLPNNVAFIGEIGLGGEL